MTKEIRIPELLAPAGNFEKLRIAVHYGADAVYIGGSGYSLRAHATFAPERIAEAVAYSHERDVKVYVTVNIFARNRDLASLPSYLEKLATAGVDGLIVADPGILAIARETVPGLPIHLSTQANVVNSASARFWERQGVSRLNLARELSLTEIRQVRAATNCQIEVFVHGALCISYSGRCLLSYYLTGRDANQGDCAHPCRYQYSVLEEKRPGQYFPVEEDERGTYIFNSRDLCLIGRLPDLLAVGVDCLKIEGRMKSPYYVAATVRAYRSALDYLRRQLREKAALPETMPPEFLAELHKVGSRGFTENFLDRPPNTKDMLFDAPRIAPSYEPVGIVRQEADPPLVEIRNPLKVCEEVEYLEPGPGSQICRITKMVTDAGEVLERANPGQTVFLHTEPAARGWTTNGLLRRRCS